MRIFLVACLLGYVLGHSDHPLAEIGVHNVRINLDPAVHLNVTPSVLTSYAVEWIEVEFSGVRHPHTHDWVGVYTPDVAAFTTKVPTRWQKCEVSPNYITTGRGSLRFRLINLRADFIVGIFTNGTTHPVLMAYSKPVAFANPNQPMQGHLALTHDSTQMRLSWGGGGKVDNFVKWGTTSKSYSHMAKANTSEYTVDQMCGSPAKDIGWISPGPLHTAIMTGLVPGQIYFYVYGNDQFTWSPEYNFTGPMPANPSTGIKLIAYGDMGVGNVDDSREHAEHKAALNTTLQVISNLKTNQLVLHVGDISYARGYGAFWEQFMEQMVPIATHVPYMTLIGNHERDYPNSGSYYNGTDSGGECGIPYEMRYNMPRPALDSAWYSVEYGNVHFLMMSTEHDFRPGSVQHDFLQKDLARVDRKKTPWVIFSGHRPMYIDSTGEAKVSELLRNTVEPLLIKYKVDLALWGHHHSYQRTCPVHRLICGQDLPTHIVIGMAGAGFSKNLHKIQPPWIKYVNDDTHGYSTIETSEKTLQFKFFANEGNKLMDEVTLTKK